MMYDYDEYAIEYTAMQDGCEVTAYTEPRRTRREARADQAAVRRRQRAAAIPDDTALVVRSVHIGIGQWQAIR